MGRYEVYPGHKYWESFLNRYRQNRKEWNFDELIRFNVLEVSGREVWLSDIL